MLPCPSLPPQVGAGSVSYFTSRRGPDSSEVEHCEYYSATEGIGATLITSEEWLAHKGSVGRPLGATVHIVGDDGAELPVGEAGRVFFESPAAPPFAYYKDPEKTARIRHQAGWATVGDVGYLDADGYLYLTDRKDFMIVSGGVNIYPQEIENLLVTHPKVADVAVFGVPHDEMGEEVKAVVQPSDPAEGGAALAEELQAFCRQHLATYKCPRSIDFADALPRARPASCTSGCCATSTGRAGRRGSEVEGN